MIADLLFGAVGFALLVMLILKIRRAAGARDRQEKLESAFRRAQVARRRGTA